MASWFTNKDVCLWCGEDDGAIYTVLVVIVKHDFYLGTASDGRPTDKDESRRDGPHGTQFWQDISETI